jgi:hypothetical protein
VTSDEFWALIDATRPAQPDPDLHADAITAALVERGVESTLAFARHFDGAMDALYRWDLWGGGYLLLGGLSDDGFEYLRAWVVGEGRVTWERVRSGPEQYLMELAAEVTADGGELFEELADRCFAEAEALLYAAGTAHEQLTGTWTPPNPDRSVGEPAGEEWDEDAVEEAFPRLASVLAVTGAARTGSGDLGAGYSLTFEVEGGGRLTVEEIVLGPDQVTSGVSGSVEDDPAGPGMAVSAGELQLIVDAVRASEERYAHGDHAGVVATLTPVLEDARHRALLLGLLPPDAAADLVYQGGISRLQCGDPDGAADWLGLAVATGADDARIPRALAQVEMTRGELDRAEAALGIHAGATATDLAIATAVAGYRRDRTEVLRRAVVALDVADRSQADMHPWDLAGVYVLVGLALLEVGEGTQCLALARMVRTLIEGAPPELPLAVQAETLAAGAHRLAGDLDAAEVALAATWPLLQPDTCDQGMTEREAARLHRAAGRPGDAADFYARAVATFRSAGERFLAAETEREAAAPS